MESTMISVPLQLRGRPTGRAVFTLATGAALALVAACGEGEASEAREEAHVTAEQPPVDEHVVITFDEAGPALTDVWLRINEPGAAAEVGRELRSVARTMRSQASLPVDSADALRLRARADELDEVARQVVEGEMEVNQTVRDVFARAHNTLSRHHLGRARAALGTNDGTLAGLHLRLAARELQTAMLDAGLGGDAALSERIESASEAADRWHGMAAASPDESRLLDELTADQERLANALGARRR